VFEDLATDLPGLYGSAGVADLVPVPAATLRACIEALDAPALATCWTDDMTLGWVYQYWNDPERERLDEKLHGGGKLEPHEIASKTQLFTERYIGGLVAAEQPRSDVAGHVPQARLDARRGDRWHAGPPRGTARGSGEGSAMPGTCRSRS
jgi:hypothetical protein